jgi:hypothetical protein
MDHQTFAQLLGSYGEFIGSIAILVTLGYLAVQVRQHSTQAKLDSFQISTERYSNLIASGLDEPERFEMFREGLSDYRSMSSARQAQFHSHLVRSLYSYQHNLELNRAGAISDAVIKEQKMDLARILICSGARQWSQSLSWEPKVQPGWDALIDDITDVGRGLKPLNEVIPFLQPDSRE